MAGNAQDHPAPAPGKLLSLWKTPDDWWILRIPWEAVPGYDFEAACRGLSNAGIQREILIDWTATVGCRIFEEFSHLHVAPRKLPYDPRRPLYCGWDFGGTPAFVATQLANTGQWRILKCLCPPEDQTWGTYDFAKEVADVLTRDFAIPAGLESWLDLETIHFGDPSGANAKQPKRLDAPKEDRASIDIIRDGLDIVLDNTCDPPLVKHLPGFGWEILPGAINVRERQDAIRARLRSLTRVGEPFLQVCPTCTTIIESFNGGYVRKQRADGSYEDEPEKNWFSHPMDALQYVATGLFQRPRSEESERTTVKRKYRSHASSRRAR